MAQGALYALQFFWLGDRSTPSPFTPAFAADLLSIELRRALVHAGFVLPYSGETAPGFHGILLYHIPIDVIQRFTA